MEHLLLSFVLMTSSPATELTNESILIDTKTEQGAKAGTGRKNVRIGTGRKNVRIGTGRKNVRIGTGRTNVRI